MLCRLRLSKDANHMSKYAKKGYNDFNNTRAIWGFLCTTHTHARTHTRRAAFQRGDLLLHAFPHNGEPDAFPDASLFESALSMAKTLSKDVLGIAPPTAVSQRDVPGWPRATIPLLVKHGVNGISIGAGQPPGKPDTPYEEPRSATQRSNFHMQLHHHSATHGGSKLIY